MAARLSFSSRIAESMESLHGAYEVEFTTLAGETAAVVTVEAGGVRPVGQHEITHARELAGIFGYLLDAKPVNPALLTPFAVR